MTSPSSSSKSAPSGVTGKNSAVALTAGGNNIELGKYRILRLLGQGGFGITYLAQDMETGQEVVIKENLHTDFAWRDPRNLMVMPVNDEAVENFNWALESFMKEAELLMQLDHPNIVKVQDAFPALGTAYYVMPWVGGSELGQAAPAPGEITEAWLAPILRQLLEALQYLHSKNILHRDIKPSNILMSESGAPVFIDFGAARAIISERSATRVGTPGYTPIEQVQSKGKRGTWTDIYALGATCYRLITGHRPPQCEDRVGDDDEYRPLAPQAGLYNRFSRDFLEAIDKALAVWGKNRWQKAEDWLATLPTPKPAESTKPIIIPPGPQPIPGPVPMPLYGKILLAALLLLLIGSGWYGYHIISVQKAQEEKRTEAALEEQARQEEEQKQKEAELAELKRQEEEQKQKEAKLAEQARLAQQREEEIEARERALAEQQKRMAEEKRKAAAAERAAREAMKKWLDFHLQHSSSNDLDFMYENYEYYVTDLKTGTVSTRSEMIQDHSNYIRNWPTRRYELIDYKISGNIIEIRTRYECTNTKGRTVSGYCKSTYRISSSGRIDGFADHSSKTHLYSFEY